MLRGCIRILALTCLQLFGNVWLASSHANAQDLPSTDRADYDDYPDYDDPGAHQGEPPVPAGTAGSASPTGVPRAAASASSAAAPVSSAQVPAASASSAGTLSASAPPPSAAASTAETSVAQSATAHSPYDLPASARWGSTRVLGEHSFLLGTFVPSGLINSHLGIRAGLEYHQVLGRVELPSLSSQAPQEVDLRTINIAETIDFAVRLHDHFAVFGDAYGKARVGANINTLLGTGADYTYGGHLGLLVKLFHLSSFQISVAGQAGYYSGQSAGVMALFQDLNLIAQGAIQEVQQNPVLDANKAVDKLNTAFRTATADLLTPFEGLTYGVSLNVAQAIGSYLGLQASVGYYAESSTYRPTRYDPVSGGPVMREHTVSTQRPSIAVAADFDASPAGLPLAILLEYRATPTSITLDLADNGQTGTEQLVALGLFYSGRTDLQLGLTTYTVYGQLATLNQDVATSDKPLDLAGQLVFRYYW